MKKWVKISLWVFLTLTVLSAIGNILQTPEQKEQIRIENERKQADKQAKEEEKKAQKEQKDEETKEKQRVFQVCNDKIQTDTKHTTDTIESNSWSTLRGTLDNLSTFTCVVSGTGAEITYAKASEDDLYAKFKKDCIAGTNFITGSEFIKKNLNDPKSYEHVNTKFLLNEDGLFDIIMTFRAKNAFNATMLSVATMQADVGCNARNLKIGN